MIWIPIGVVAAVLALDLIEPLSSRGPAGMSVATRNALERSHGNV